MQVTKYNLLKNIHETLIHPTNDGITHLVRGNYDYYHYNCTEGNDDIVSCKQNQNEKYLLCY